MSYPTRKILYTIGGPEAPAGTAAARTNAIPIRGVPGLTRVPTRMPDPAIIGSDMDIGDYLAADSIEGPLPLTPRAVAGFGKPLKSLLGTESAPVQIGGCIRIRYVGASASCKIVGDTGANTLAAKTGALGAEADAGAWGGGAPLSLIAAPTDTLGELVTVIDGYADWVCEKVFGADAVVAQDIVTKTTQAKNKWAYLWFTVAATGAYERHYTRDLTTAEHPTYSIQCDNYPDNFLYAGCTFSALSINAAMKAMIEADAEVLGFAETGGQGASAVVMEDVPPFFFWDGAFDLAGTTFPFINTFSLRVDNKHNKEGYGQGAVGRIYHEKGIPEITGDLEIKLDANSWARRAGLFTSTSTLCSMSMYFTGGIISGVIPELFLIELPYAQMTDWKFGEKNGLFTAKMNYKGVYPKGVTWDVPLFMTLITRDAAAY